jgi:hypothetical protein
MKKCPSLATKSPSGFQLFQFHLCAVIYELSQGGARHVLVGAEQPWRLFPVLLLQKKHTVTAVTLSYHSETLM